MNQKIKLAIVDYHNTSTFIKGLELLKQHHSFEVIRATPANCSVVFAQDEVDVALVPVGSLADLKNYQIITDYCIGCTGDVYSVAIFSNFELDQCNKLVLDYESRSSNKLAEIICNEFMFLDLKCITNDDDITPTDRTAYVLIGDKVFSQESMFKYKYDLGGLWQKFTGLPFTFAVWIARPGTNSKFIEDLNECFNKKVLDIASVNDLQLSPNLSLKTYLSEFISFELDAKKIKAMEMFREMQNEVVN